MIAPIVLWLLKLMLCWYLSVCKPLPGQLMQLAVALQALQSASVEATAGDPAADHSNWLVGRLNCKLQRTLDMLQA